MKLHGIYLVGLGPGNPNQLTLEAWEILNAADEIWLRTEHHPTVAKIPRKTKLHTFDAIYEAAESFSAVYEKITAEVLRLADERPYVVYAVPGHPFVAEEAAVRIAEQAAEKGIVCKVVEGLSFLEPTFSALKVDPFPEMVITDAVTLQTMYHPSFPPDRPALIGQVYSQQVASDLKLTLMAVYPDEFPVVLVHGAGTVEEKVEHLMLFEIDRSEEIGLLTSLYLPALGENTSIEHFQDLIAHLRAPEGCPWDRKQDHQTLRRNLLEEAYEVLEAIDEDDADKMQEELGDLLLQIVLHAQIGMEYGEFGMTDVISGIYEKLYRRHPHVFGNAEESDDPDEVLANWEKIKAEERKNQPKKEKGILDGVSKALPALSLAEIYMNRASRVGFKWNEMAQVIAKVEEEFDEFANADDDSKHEEFGDVLFALTNLARWHEIDPEAALRDACKKFYERFTFLEAQARKDGKEMSDFSIETMLAFWNEAKH